MSVPLPAIDMSIYVVGQGGVVTLDQAKQTQPSSAAHSTDKAHLRIFNDSGSHLQVWMDTGDLNEYLPAGGWLTWDIDQTANEFHWNVINVLSNPPVNLMLITYYRQGETVPEIPTLGNSPIGGAVASTGGSLGTADHLINTTNAASSSPIINIEETGASGAQMFADNQGNLTISQYVSSILTTLFRVLAGAGINADNVLISDAQHKAHVLGSLTVDNVAFFNSQIQAQGAQNQAGSPAIYLAGIGGGTGIEVTTSPPADNAAVVGYEAFGGATLNPNSIGYRADGQWGIGFDATGSNGAIGMQWANGGVLWNNGTINNGNNAHPGQLVQTGNGGDVQTLAAGALVLNGGTSGTATLYQYMRGNVKMVVCKLNNFRTAGADQRIQLPVQLGSAGSGGVIIQTGDCEACSLQLVAGTDLGMRALTVLGASAGAAGTTGPTSTFSGNGFYNMGNGFAYLNFKAGWAAGRGGIIMIMGCEG